MATPEDLASFNRLRFSGISAEAQILPKVPEMPPDVKKRFPSLEQWEQEMEKWRVKATIALRGGAA